MSNQDWIATKNSDGSWTLRPDNSAGCMVAVGVIIALCVFFQHFEKEIGDVVVTGMMAAIPAFIAAIVAFVMSMTSKANGHDARPGAASCLSFVVVFILCSLFVWFVFQPSEMRKKREAEHVQKIQEMEKMHADSEFITE